MKTKFITVTFTEATNTIGNLNLLTHQDVNSICRLKYFNVQMANTMPKVILIGMNGLGSRCEFITRDELKQHNSFNPLFVICDKEIIVDTVDLQGGFGPNTMEFYDDKHMPILFTKGDKIVMSFTIS